MSPVYRTACSSAILLEFNCWAERKRWGWVSTPFLSSSWPLSGKRCLISTTDFFLLARIRKSPTPLFILFPLVPSGSIQASEGEPGPSQDSAECDKATQHTREIDRLHPRHKDTLPRSLFCEEKNCSFSSVLSGSGRKIRTQARSQWVLSVSKVEAGTYSPPHPVGHTRSQPK